MVTPLQSFTFLCDLGDFTAEPKLLSLVVFCPCCRLADTWQQAPWLSKGQKDGLYMAVLSYWVILVCQKRCHDVKSRWNVYVTEAGILAFQCLGMQYELIGYRLWLTVACHSKTYASSARACDSRWFWCISYIFIHAPQCCKFSSCFVILVFWDEGPRHTCNA